VNAEESVSRLPMRTRSSGPAVGSPPMKEYSPAPPEALEKVLTGLKNLTEKKTWIVTVKLPKNPEHNRPVKKTGPCPFSLNCTDVTGEYHSFTMHGDDSEQVQMLVRLYMETKGFPSHITRIEQV
jgi:hypothetical protein